LLKKLLICPWYGDLPPWWSRYCDSYHPLLAQGYDLMHVSGLDGFKARVRDKLNIDCPIVSGEGKIHDYRAALGLLYADELTGYDYWGHTDFDCVYGRVEHFMPDERLAELDVYSDHPSYLCGPWTLYRNTPALNEAFMDVPGWKETLEEPRTTGWVETSFTEHINSLGLKTLYELNHGYLSPHLLSREGRVLREGAKEISMFHFRHSKVWPL
jgi:hypothetical protein